MSEFQQTEFSTVGFYKKDLRLKKLSYRNSAEGVTDSVRFCEHIHKTFIPNLYENVFDVCIHKQHIRSVIITEFLKCAKCV